MRTLSGPLLTYLQSREGYEAKSLLWVSARNRTTGAVETYGLWTGDYDAIFTIGGVSRTYVAGGGLKPVEAIVMRAGLEVRQLRIALNPLHPTVALMLRGSDAGLAAAQLHRAFFDPMSGNLIEEPQRVWKGWVDGAPIHTPEVGGEATAELTLVSAARALTRNSSLVKSDAVQRQRGGDRMRRFQDVSGAVSVWWGSKRTSPVVSTPSSPGQSGSPFKWSR